MVTLFTAIGGRLCRVAGVTRDNDRVRLAKAILSANAVPLQSQLCDACGRCSTKFTSTYTIPVGQFDTMWIAFGVSARTHRRPQRSGGDLCL